MIDNLWVAEMTEMVVGAISETQRLLSEPGEVVFLFVTFLCVCLFEAGEFL
ncbi:hypothetical protein HanPSC8_Chr11g0457561 [Helianthus annuus]|nr:hypothetical protein HanPSC8_Chr11g0457561 [Helianthus annuus]